MKARSELEMTAVIIHSFNTYLLFAYYMQSTDLGVFIILVNKTRSFFSGGPYFLAWGKETLKNSDK